MKIYVKAGDVAKLLIFKKKLKFYWNVLWEILLPTCSFNCLWILFYFQTDFALSIVVYPNKIISSDTPFSFLYPYTAFSQQSFLILIEKSLNVYSFDELSITAI